MTRGDYRMHAIRQVDTAEPMQRLAAAVITQAMEDARGGPYAHHARRWLLDEGAVWLGLLTPSRESPAVLMAGWIEAQPWFQRARRVA